MDASVATALTAIAAEATKQVKSAHTRMQSKGPAPGRVRPCVPPTRSPLQPLPSKAPQTSSHAAPEQPVPTAQSLRDSNATARSCRTSGSCIVHAVMDL
jgi:hypothetical protein